MDKFFSAKHVAIIGVSRDTRKVGHVIFRNFVDEGFRGKFYVVNNTADAILGHPAYKSVLDVPARLDLAIVAVPAEASIQVVDECGRKGIKNVIIVTAGYREEGNMELDKRLEETLKKWKIRCVGPNCLGTFDAYTKLDTLFLPRYRLRRPPEGRLSFVCQSGAVGSSILDLATSQGYGFSKFVSYGNAMNTDESDLIEYLGKDSKTKVICLYIEGAVSGKKFLKTCRAVTRRKPIVALKGGRTEEGSKAAISHTGSLAGSADVYSAVFRQAGVLEVFSLEEMFEVAKVLEKAQKPAGNRIMAITNGGGYGILSTDAIVQNGMKLASLSGVSRERVRKELPRVHTENPMDLLGDASTEGYKTALDIAVNDKNVDVVLLIILYQTPLVTPEIVDIVVEYNDMKKKPIVVVSAGGEFTEVLKQNLESNGIPNYTYPENAIRAVRRLVEY